MNILIIIPICLSLFVLSGVFAIIGSLVVRDNRPWVSPKRHHLGLNLIKISIALFLIPMIIAALFFVGSVVWLTIQSVSSFIG